MMMYRKSNLFLAGVMIFVVNSFVPAQTPVSTTQTGDLKPEIENISDNQITINDLVHFGDVIEVDVLGSFEYDWRGTLNPEGFLDKVEFVDKSFFGLCRNVESIAEEIEIAYSKFLRDPKVIVRILDRSKRPKVFMYGAVKNQQRFMIKRPTRLNELIILSGGLTDKASGEIQIFRSANAGCATFINKSEKKAAEENQERFVNASQDNGSNFINIKISELLKGLEQANPRILNGDIITVIEAKPIYVVGGVENPKTISSREKLTLSRAIASAGGLTKDAEGQEITVIRRQDYQTKVLKANLEFIKSGEAEDLILEPYDIVDVPQKGKINRNYTKLRDELLDQKIDSSKLPLVIID